MAVAVPASVTVFSRTSVETEFVPMRSSVELLEEASARIAPSPA